MADDSNQAAPRLALLVAQRLTQVRQHEQFVSGAALPERRPACLPTAGAAGETQFLNCRCATERRLQSQFAGRVADERHRILPEQFLARAIDEDQPMLVVEREDRDVDLRHDRSKKGSRFLRPETLNAQRFGERVDLEHDVRERIAAGRFARADGEVTLPHRGEKIGDGLKRTRDAIAHDHGERDPGGGGEHERGDAHERRVVAEPQQHGAQRDRRQRRRHREQRDAPIVSKERHHY